MVVKFASQEAHEEYECEGFDVLAEMRRANLLGQDEGPTDPQVQLVQVLTGWQLVRS